MSFNLLESVKHLFNNDIVNKASGFLGESSSSIQNGLSAVIPVSLAGIINKAQSGNSESLLNMAREAYNSGILNHLGNTFSSEGGGVPAGSPSLISNLFGDKFGSIANAVSSFTNLKGASTASLFGSVIPLSLAVLGKHAKESALAPGGLASFLGSQKASILSAIPGGLNLSNLFGDPLKVSSSAVHTETVEKKTNWTMPILVLIGLAIIAWLLSRGCHKTEEAGTTVVHDTTVKRSTDTMYITKEPVKLKLPNGVEIDAYKGGIEDLLIAFLNDPNAKPGKDNWFDFTDLNFKFGTAEIVPESANEVRNIVEILKAYPNTRIKIGGYTDKVGDEATNKKLSKERAEAVTKELSNAGVGSQIEAAEGYGSEFAKYPASAPEEDRIKDRRVSVSVRAK